MDRTVAPPASPTDDRRRWIERGLEHLAWLLLLVALAVFSASIPGFSRADTLIGILDQSAATGILAAGLALVIIAGQIDLSGESVAGLAAMAAAMAFGTGGVGMGWTIDPAWLAVPATLAGAILIGALAGLVNGVLVVQARINPFIVTLGAYMVLRGVTLWISGGHRAAGLPAEILAVATGRALGLPIPAWILGAVFLAFGAVLRWTNFGRGLMQVGGDPQAAAHAGVRAGQLVVVAFALAGGLAALAGWLLLARATMATAYLGFGLLLPAFAAVAIGGVSLKGGAGRLSGVFAGVLLLGAIDAAIRLTGLPAETAQVAQAALVLAAVLLEPLKTTIRERLR
ncbi:ribose transport system permease protein [Inquilinus ginsengisoli]|uniref:Autoinducer 2 import system permease protein LsrD n=1 Tax=Inquilinus ginsengisoli TaxID=363840 RepID=A0ABU1JZQ2_9PROT|nr:ABC transporter permease [Inquilinus ginsengisoli]MDR6294100.1 ribose transport system permease protein [Inquilinus ginsengisoli]